MPTHKLIAQNPIKGIYLDMDGPLVDDMKMWSKARPLVANMREEVALLEIFGQKQKFVSPIILECIEKNFFQTASPTSFAIAVKNILLPYWKELGIEVEILSSSMAVNPLRESLVSQKKAWLKQHGFGHLKANIVEGSLKKQEYAKEGWLLIDDYSRTISQFVSKGGYGIQYQSLNQVMPLLRLLNLSPQVY